MSDRVKNWCKLIDEKSKEMNKGKAAREKKEGKQHGHQDSFNLDVFSENARNILKAGQDNLEKFNADRTTNAEEAEVLRIQSSFSPNVAEMLLPFREQHEKRNAVQVNNTEEENTGYDNDKE